MASLLLAFISAFVACLALTPLIRSLAPCLRLMDQPDGTRKLHGSGMPLGGGLAIFLAVTWGVLLVTFLPQRFKWQTVASAAETFWRTFQREHIGIISGAVMVCLVGLLDDRWTLRGRHKLAGQLVAVFIVALFGLGVRQVSVLGVTFELGLLVIPFTMFWLLVAVNSMNLIDGADGMATTVGIIVSLAVSAMAWLSGHPADAIIAAALGGALCGFLVFNFPPASIFLGDAGSMLIGMTLGIIAMRSSFSGPATVALAAPLALLAVPIFDCFSAILRRQLTGRSIYTSDRGHLHHCLLRKGITDRMMLLYVAVLCGAGAAGALLSVLANSEVFALLGVLSVIGTLVAGRVFGHAELCLLATKLTKFGRTLVPAGFGAQPPPTRQVTVRLQGTRNWDEVWEILTEFAEKNELCRVKLDVNVVCLHESYHAVWERCAMPEQSRQWMTRIPIEADARSIGRLEISGILHDDSMYSVLSVLAEFLDSVGTVFDRLADSDHIGVEKQLHPSRGPAATASEAVEPVESAVSNPLS